MKLYNAYGRLVNKNVAKYKMEWEKKSRSQIQFKTKQFLKPYWISSLCYEEFPVFGTLLKVDFLNATTKLAVEVNGNQHDTFNKFFHQNRGNFLASLKRDERKRDWLERNDYQFLELHEDDIGLLSAEYIFEKFAIRL